MSWALYGIIVTQLGDFNDRLIELTDGSLQTVPQFLEGGAGCHTRLLFICFSAVGMQRPTRDRETWRL